MLVPYMAITILALAASLPVLIDAASSAILALTTYPSVLTLRYLPLHTPFIDFAAAHANTCSPLHTPQIVASSCPCLRAHA